MSRPHAQSARSSWPRWFGLQHAAEFSSQFLQRWTDQSHHATLASLRVVNDPGYDRSLVGVVIALFLTSVVMVYSATVALPDNPKFNNYTPYHFLIRHVLFIFIGLMAAIAAFQIPLRIWERYAPWLFAGTLILLVLVLMTLDWVGVFQFPAIRISQTCRVVICRRVYETAHGHQRTVFSCRYSDGCRCAGCWTFVIG
jgi:hypothetical protein